MPVYLHTLLKQSWHHDWVENKQKVALEISVWSYIPLCKETDIVFFYIYTKKVFFFSTADWENGLKKPIGMKT